MRHRAETDESSMSVHQVGTIEPSLANNRAAKYQALQLPDGPTRTAFLAEHCASVTAIVDFGPPGVDADLNKTLSNLGPYGYVITIARGSVVDQDALVELLVRGRLASVGLDVFAEEPYVPTELRGLDNVVLPPHIGGVTVRGLSMMRDLVLRNLHQYLTRGTLIAPVVLPTSYLHRATLRNGTNHG
jgi:D-isomer specific 2-hydroxyacid dehydrogenase, NAD binding domain